MLNKFYFEYVHTYTYILQIKVNETHILMLIAIREFDTLPAGVHSLHNMVI